MSLDRLAEQIIASTVDGIAVVNEEGIIVEWNQAAGQVTGISRVEAVGQPFWDMQMRLVPSEKRRPELREQYKEQILQACRTGQASWLGQVLEVDIVRPDGGKRIVQQTVFAIGTEKGFMIGSSTRDVTERRQAERALAQREAELRQAHEALSASELRYRQMFEHNRAIKWLIDPDSGQIVDANQAASSFYGYPLERLKQMTVFDLNVLPREEVVAAMQDARSRAGAAFVFQHRLASGEMRDVEVYTGPILMEGRTFLFSIVQDVSDRVQAEEALRGRNRQLEILHDIDRAILAAQSAKEIAEAAVHEIRRLIPCERAGLMTFDHTAGIALMLALDADKPSALPAGRTISLEEVLPTIERVAPESVSVADIRALPALSTSDRCLVADGICSYVRIPLVAGGSIIGSLNLNWETAGPPRADQLAIGQRIADSLAVAIHHADLNEQVRVSREQLRRLSRRLVEVQEHERRHVAGTLYDDVGQRLATLLVGLRLLEQQIARAGPVSGDIAELKRQTADMLADLHSLATHLRPASLEQLGLVAALAQYVEQFGREHGLHVELTVVGMEEERPAQQVETALYWIAQEALANVVHHAEATAVEVVVRRDDERLLLLVADNGVGFEPSPAGPDAHLGLLTLRERAAMLGGSLEWETAPGQGTTVLLEVPWEGRENKSNSEWVGGE